MEIVLSVIVVMCCLLQKSYALFLLVEECFCNSVKLY